MTILFLTFAALFLPGIIGFIVLTTIDNEGLIHGVEKIALSFPVGAGLLSFYMFFVGIFGFHYSFTTLAPFFIMGLASLVLVRKRKKAIGSISIRQSNITNSKIAVVISLILVSLILWKLFYIFFNTFTYPSYFQDAVTTWDYKAKAIYTMLGLGSGSSEIFLGGSITNYPISTALFKAWMAILAGTWKDQYIHLYHITIFVSMILLFYTNLRRHASYIVTLSFCYILVSIPLMAVHVYSGYVDMVVGFYLLASILMLARWFHTVKEVFLYVTVIMAAIMMFIKNEGLVLFMPSIALTFVSFLLFGKLTIGGKKRGMIVSIIGLLILIGPWIAAKIVFGLSINNFALEFHPEAFTQLAKIFFGEDGSFSILWIGITFIFLSNYRGILNNTFLSYFVPALLSLLAVTMVFIFTSNYEWLRIRTTINRSLLIVAPSLLFSAGILIGLTFSGKESKSSSNKFGKN